MGQTCQPFRLFRIKTHGGMGQSGLVAALVPGRVREGDATLAKNSDFLVVISDHAASSKALDDFHAFGRRRPVSNDVAGDSQPATLKA